MIYTPKRGVIALVAFAAAVAAVKIAEAQFVAPTCVPPACNPSVIQNIPLTGTAQSASFNVTGDGKVGNRLLGGQLESLGKLIVGTGTTNVVAGDSLYIGNMDAASGGDFLRLMTTSGGLPTIRFTVSKTGAVAADSYIGVGSGLTNLNASNISFGTLSVARLPSNVALRDAVNNFTTTNTFVGNVGIGTTSPGYQLHLQYGAATGQIGGASQLVLQSETSHGLQLTACDACGQYIDFGSTGSSAAGFFRFNDTVANGFAIGTGGSLSAFTIQSDGRIGIGTAAPAASVKMQINAPVSTEGLRIVSAADWSPINVRNSANTADIFRVDQTGSLAVGSVPWARLSGFPAACPAGQYASAVDGTLTCSAPAFAEADTLQTVTNRGNVTTQVIGVGGASPIVDRGINVQGTAYGVYGVATDAGSTGMYGQGTANGMYGQGTAIGTTGIGTGSSSTGVYGVGGVSGYGVVGNAGYAGIYGDGASYGGYFTGTTVGVYAFGTTAVEANGAVTVSGNTTLGDATTDQTAINGKFVLGGIGADPAGANGMIFYNTAANKFRCYENGAWKDCTTGGVASVTGSGAGISVAPTTGAVVVSNTGVTSAVAGTGISVSGAAGAVTITNTGDTNASDDVGGSGTANTIPKFTAATTLGNSLVTDNGTTVTAGGAFSVTGNATLGDAGADSATFNAATWSIPNTTAVSLNNAADAVNFDANTLSIDALNNRVGVGTAAPTSKLHVSGDAIVTGAIAANGEPLMGNTGVATRGSFAGLYANGNAAASFGVYASGGAAPGDGSYGVYGLGTSYGVYGDSANIAVYGNSTNIAGYFNGLTKVVGKLIATDTAGAVATAQMNVARGANFDSTIAGEEDNYTVRVTSNTEYAGALFERQDTTTPANSRFVSMFANSPGDTGIRFTDTASKFVIAKAPYANRTSLGTGATEIVTILPSGIVGINDSSPTATLDVVSPITTGTGFEMHCDSLTGGNCITLQTSSTALDGDLQEVLWSSTYTAVAPSVTGSLYKGRRQLTYNNGAGTLTVSGPVATFSDTMTVTAGAVTHNAPVVEVIQNYASNTGDALKVTTAGAGSALSLSGDMKFVNDGDSITFAAADATNNPMIQMFASGISNGDRMVISHSPAFTDYGLQYADSVDEFRFLGAGTNMLTIDVTSPNPVLTVNGQSNPAATFNRATTDGTIVNLAQAGVVEGTISVSGTTVSYNAFTGSHYGWTKETLKRGMLVSLTGDNRNYHGDSAAEPIYGIVRTAQANDPKAFGSYLALLDPKKPYGADNPHLIMAVGNGDMWVVENAGNIQPGDELISSDTPGHAMKDPGTYVESRVVAKAAEAVDWSKVTDRIDGKKHKKISVLFAVYTRKNTRPLEERIKQLEAALKAILKK